MAMLAYTVRRELEGHPAACKYECDSEIGCKHCTPKDMAAKPALPSKRFSPNGSWIIDTGSSNPRGRTPSRDAKPKKGKGKGRTNSPKGKKECRF